MNASKENARAAQEKLRHMHATTVEGPERQFVREFLEAAERKLPSEAAYKKDKTRSRKKRKTAKV